MNTTTKFISAGILLVGVIVLNFIAGFAKNARIDTTHEKIFSLTEGTKEVLKSIEGDIEIDFYFSRSRDEVPVNIKNQADRVINLLQQFKNNYPKKQGSMTLTIIDPKPDTDEEEVAEKSDFGIKGRLGNTLFYTGIKLVYEGEEANINFLQESEAFLEHEITTTLYGLVNDSKPIVGLVNSMDRMEEHNKFFEKLKSFYEVKSIGMTANNLPDLDEGKKFAAIVVIHPKNITDQLQYALDQYLLSGGKLFVCVDAHSWLDQYANGNIPQMPMMGMQMPSKIDANSDLEKLFKAWGVKYDKNKVLADFTSQIPLPKLGDYPAWIRIQGADQIRKNDYTGNAKLLTFMEPGYFTMEEGNGLEFTPLVQSSTSAGTVPRQDVPETRNLYSQYPFDPFQVNPVNLRTVKRQLAGLNASIEKNPNQSRYNIAGILKGNFKTAFPDGKPADESKDNADADKEEDKKDEGSSLKEGNGEVILFTDWDFLNGMFQRYQSEENMRPVFAENDVLALNLVDHLVTGNNKLSKVNIKGDSFRPFDKIMALEAERQVKINEQNKEIDKKIQELNDQLQEEVNKLNTSMQQKQRDAQIQLRQKSQEVQKQLEPYVKYMKPDGSISLDRQKDKETIDKLMALQNEMGTIRQQVQQDTLAGIQEMQKQIEVKQESANEEIEKLEKQKRKDRKEGREGIEALEMKVQLANMLIMPLIVIGVGITFFSKRKNQRA
jgi:ABC-type uncharacterized transport system involved in gliding motility auxiliary subunit